MIASDPPPPARSPGTGDTGSEAGGTAGTARTAGTAGANGSATASAPRRALLTRLAQILVEFALFGVGLFVSAGTPAWWNAWLFLGLSVLIVVANGIYLLPRNPEVVVERGRGHAGTRTFDRVFAAGYTACFLALLVVAGLDGHRWRWATLGWIWVLVGAVVLCASDIPVAAAMAANRHLEQTVRIQHERDHRVVDTGPYRFVRHPMYAGMLAQLPATALLLGSAWALVPALGAAVAIVIRTLLEDRTLRRDLPGYAAYARQTRYRLVPRIW